MVDPCRIALRVVAVLLFSAVCLPPALAEAAANAEPTGHRPHSDDGSGEVFDPRVIGEIRLGIPTASWEAIDRRFLSRHFDSNDGMLYEGNYGCDIGEESCFEEKFDTDSCDKPRDGGSSDGTRVGQVTVDFMDCETARFQFEPDGTDLERQQKIARIDSDIWKYCD